MAKLENKELLVGELVKDLLRFNQAAKVVCKVNTADASEGSEHDRLADLEIMGVDLAEQSEYCEILASRDNTEVVGEVEDYVTNLPTQEYESDYNFLMGLRDRLPKGSTELSLEMVMELYLDRKLKSKPSLYANQ